MRVVAPWCNKLLKPLCKLLKPLCIFLSQIGILACVMGLYYNKMALFGMAIQVFMEGTTPLLHVSSS